MPDVMPYMEIIGYIGSALFILGFGALNLGLVRAESYTYQLANIIGALCFTYTALAPFNVGLFITEAVWALIGVYGIVQVIKVSKAKKAKGSSTNA